MRPTTLLFCYILAVTALANASPAQDLVSAARSQIGITLHYDPSYQRLAYPGGDVPLERGVCTDVVIRAYRQLGIDLQKLVHEDMRKNWSSYPHPSKWNLKRPTPISTIAGFPTWPPSSAAMARPSHQAATCSNFFLAIW